MEGDKGDSTKRASIPKSTRRKVDVGELDFLKDEETSERRRKMSVESKHIELATQLLDFLREQEKDLITKLVEIQRMITHAESTFDADEEGYKEDPRVQSMILQSYGQNQGNSNR